MLTTVTLMDSTPFGLTSVDFIPTKTGRTPKHNMRLVSYMRLTGGELRRKHKGYYRINFPRGSQAYQLRKRQFEEAKKGKEQAYPEDKKDGDAQTG